MKLCLPAWVTRALLFTAVLSAVSACKSSGQPAPVIAPPAPRLSPMPPPSGAEYRLRIGDVIQVRLYERPELAELLPIRPDGRISLQLVGETTAAGRSVAELSSHLTEEYGKTFRNPNVAVIVKEFARHRVYVGGEVNLPGVLEVATDLTALQAIFQAGGAKDTAELRTVMLIRYQGSPEPKYVVLNLRADLQAADPETPEAPIGDLLLQPFDMVYVPKTRIAEMNQWVREHITQLVPATLSLGITYFFGGVIR